MGLLEKNLLDDHIFVIKNSFIDVATQLSDGAPPPAPDLCRARTAPPPTWSRASTTGNSTPRSPAGSWHESLKSDPECSTRTDIFQRDGLRALPAPRGTQGQTSRTDAMRPCQSDRVVAVRSCLSEREDVPLPEHVKWAVRVRHTFLEYHWSPWELRRTASMPDLVNRKGSSEGTVSPKSASPTLAVPAAAVTFGDASCRGGGLAAGTESPPSWPAPAWPVSIAHNLQQEWQTPPAWEPYVPMGYTSYVAGDGISYWMEHPQQGHMLDADYQQCQWRGSFHHDESTACPWQQEQPQSWPVTPAAPVSPAGEAVVEINVGGSSCSSPRRRRGSSTASTDVPPRALPSPQQYFQAGWQSHQQLMQSHSSQRDRTTSRGQDIIVDDSRALEVLVEARRAAADRKVGKVWETACRDRDGSLAVQKVVKILAETMRESSKMQDWGAHEAAVYDSQAVLAGLHGHVLEAMKHPHANHVIKEVVQYMPTEHIGFVASELSGHGAWAATHCYGCRTVLRLAKHCRAGGWAGQCVDGLVDEVLAVAGDLCGDEYGKFVLEEFLEHGLPEHRRQVTDALRQRLLRNARHRYASGLIEKALKSCEPEDAARIVSELFGNRDTVLSLLRNHFGLYVLRDLALSSHHIQQVRRSLTPMAAELQTTKQGRKLWELISSLEPAVPKSK